MTWTICNLPITQKCLVNNDGDKQHLQNDIDKLVKWSEKWHILLHFGKCICRHKGHGNVDVNYKMGYTF